MNNKSTPALLLCMIGLMCSCVTSGREKAVPGDPFKGENKITPLKKPVATREFLLAENARRDSIEKPEMIMDLIGVRPGMVVGEAGAGEGYFTFHLSKRVGEGGKIFANDISEFEISTMEKYAGEFGVRNNIVSVLGKIDDPCFPSRDLDMIVIFPGLCINKHFAQAFFRPGIFLENQDYPASFALDMLGAEPYAQADFKDKNFQNANDAGYHSFHDFEKRSEWLAHAYDYLKPGGILAIADGYNPDHGALTKELVTGYGVQAGFRFLFYEKPSWHVHVFIKD